MSKLSVYSTPAERIRGCIFAERFLSATEVTSNEGTQTGVAQTIANGEWTVTATANYIRYASRNIPQGTQPCTLMAWVKCASNPSTYAGVVSYGVTQSNGRTMYVGVKNGSFAGGVFGTNINGTTAFVANQWFHIALSYDGTKGYLYVNGVLQNAGGTALTSIVNEQAVFVGSVGTGFSIGGVTTSASIKEAKIFNVVLTAEEISDYYTKSTFNYMTKALLNYPMVSETHDPTNKKLLDRNGKGYNATFGDNTTATTFPVKLAGRGYTCSRGNNTYFDIGNITALESQNFSFAILCTRNELAQFHHLLSIQMNAVSGSQSGWYCRFTNTNLLTVIKFTDTTTAVALNSTATYNNNTLYAIVGIKNGTNVRVWVNGNLDISGDYASATINYTNANTKRSVMSGNWSDSGAGGTTSLALTGTLNQVMMWNYALTQTQAIDLGLKLLKGVNVI